MTENACHSVIMCVSYEFITVMNRGIPSVPFILGINFTSGKIFSMAKLSGS
jgi:hypothetical protein